MSSLAHGLPSLKGSDNCHALGGAPCGEQRGPDLVSTLTKNKDADLLVPQFRNRQQSRASWTRQWTMQVLMVDSAAEPLAGCPWQHSRPKTR